MQLDLTYKRNIKPFKDIWFGLNIAWASVLYLWFYAMTLTLGISLITATIMYLTQYRG